MKIVRLNIDWGDDFNKKDSENYRVTGGGTGGTGRVRSIKIKE